MDDECEALANVQQSSFLSFFIAKVWLSIVFRNKQEAICDIIYIQLTLKTDLDREGRSLKAHPTKSASFLWRKRGVVDLFLSYHANLARRGLLG